ncbi:MAG: hypothetical protein QM579_13530 [Desulfovibrio sp.]|uniref:hypothetical protein n=1 Tax=Desulfovibrio sp. TaxID=885 RepID=UPI0039E44E3E
MSIRIGSDSIMAQNFFSASSEESRYTRGRHLAAQADKQAMSSRQSSILAAGMAACAATESMSQRILEGKKAARQMGFDMQQSAFEASERNLDELRRRLEEKAKQNQKNPADNKDAASAADPAIAEAAANSPGSVPDPLSNGLPSGLSDGLAGKAGDLAANIAANLATVAGSVTSKGAIEPAGAASGNLTTAGRVLLGESLDSGAGVASTVMAAGGSTGGQSETFGILVVV